MRNLKRLCTLIAALVLCCSAILSASAAETYIVLYGFAFDFNGEGNAVIHGYDDRSADVVIPDTLMGGTVSEIADFACFGDTAITSVSFEQATGLTRIGYSAFYGCTGLQTLTLSSPLREVGSGAFQNCTGLQTLTVEDGLQTIPAQCFYGCSALSSVELPASVTAIGERAFEGCISLCRLDLSDQIASIADNAFSGCSNLVIYAKSDSYAFAYAGDHRIARVSTDGYLLGDADGDSYLNVLDATKIQRVIADLIDDADGSIALRGDADQNGLDILDATRIQRFIAEMDVAGVPVGSFIYCNDELNG